MTAAAISGRGKGATVLGAGRDRRIRGRRAAGHAGLGAPSFIGVADPEQYLAIEGKVEVAGPLLARVVKGAVTREEERETEAVPVEIKSR
jgi:hypothetical protein